MISTDDPLGLLRPAVGRCLGAAFVTHALDERFLEQVLAALLPIDADPEADAHFFIDEGRRRLRQTPVVVLADARQYVGGHRLPFEVVLAPWDTRVHAHLSLLLFEDHARLLSGSGNLTRNGFGKNAELFTVSTLRYDRDGAVFRKVLHLFTDCGASGDGWKRLTAQLEVLLPGGKPPRTGAVGEPTLLTGDDVVAQFLDAIPASARVERISLALAPSPEDEPGDLTPFVERVTAWVKKRAPKAPVQVVLPWHNGQGPLPADADLEGAVGRIAAFRRSESLAWGEVAVVDSRQVALVTADEKRVSIKRVPDAEPRLWVYDEAVGAGPVEALESLSSTCDVSWWLWPTHVPGEPSGRPLHGAWLLVHAKQAARRRSYLLAGSFQPAVPKEQRLITAGVALSFDKPLELASLAPQVVRAPSEGFFLEEAWLPPARLAPPPPATACVYDAARRTLRIAWRPRARGVKATYIHADDEIVLVESSSGLETLVRDFDLHRGSAEIVLRHDEHVWFMPISVSHLEQLPADEGARPTTLRAWVAHYIGGNAIIEDVDEGPSAASLAPSPRDVFTAIDTLRTLLGDTGASLGEFEVLLHGPFGCGALAALLAPDADPSLMRAEAWLYGQELLRALGGLRLADNAADRARRSTLRAHITALGATFDAAAPKDGAVSAVKTFYRSGR